MGCYRTAENRPLRAELIHRAAKRLVGLPAQRLLGGVRPLVVGTPGRFTSSHPRRAAVPWVRK
jgi:hypothetical protein